MQSVIEHWCPENKEAAQLDKCVEYNNNKAKKASAPSATPEQISEIQHMCKSGKKVYMEKIVTTTPTGVAKIPEVKKYWCA